MKLGERKQGSDKMRTQIETAILHCDVVAINKTEKKKTETSHKENNYKLRYNLCDMDAVRMWNCLSDFWGSIDPTRRGECNANPHSKYEVQETSAREKKSKWILRRLYLNLQLIVIYIHFPKNPF